MENATTSIYDYKTFSEFLSAYVKRRKSVQANYSYMVLARQVGSKSPSLLTQIGLGRRLPTPSLMHKLKKALKLSKREYEYATQLVGMQRGKSADERAEYAERLRRLEPSNPGLVHELDRHDFFGKWYNAVILEMFRLGDRNTDAKWFQQRLGGRITRLEAEASLDLLRRLGMIQRGPDGTLTTRLEEHTATPQNFPSETIRAFHRHMMAMAGAALETQTVQERYVAGTTIAVKTARLAEAQEAIREFRRKFCEEFQAQDGDEVFHLASQFFRVTAPRAKAPTTPAPGGLH